MGTKGFVLYLISGFSVTILSTFFISNNPINHFHKHPLQLFSLNSSLTHNQDGFGLLQINGFSTTVKVWPDLEFNWKSVLATIIGFFGSGFGTVGGVGGGGIFVPMLNLIVGFDTKSAAALSKCMIMGASASSVWYNLRIPHPSKDVPIIDYELALLFQPMLMLGITIGVSLSVVFPYWLITILIIILFLGTSSRSFFKGIQMWKEETILHTELDTQKQAPLNSHGELLIEPLLNKEEKSRLEILRFNLRWKRLLVLGVVWVSFLLLQIIKNDTKLCSVWYWVVNILQIPVALAVFGYEAVKLYRESKKRRMNGNTESVCEAEIDWTVLNIVFCACFGLLGGTIGGLQGSGGGFILGPLILELGVIPQVLSTGLGRIVPNLISRKHTNSAATGGANGRNFQSSIPVEEGMGNYFVNPSVTTTNSLGGIVFPFSF